MLRNHTSKPVVLVVVVILLSILATFTTLAYLGDLNLDDLVNGSDFAILLESFGTYQTNPAYNRFADLNLDDNVNVKDLAIAGRSYSSTYNFHYPRQISNSIHNVIYLSSCIDGSDRIHIAWSEDNNVYYTRLDRFGNTLIDDLLLEHGGFAGNDAVAIGCDDQGDSYMIWDCADSVDGTCLARIDSYGYLVMKGRLDTQRKVINYPAVDLDSSGRAHVFYTRYGVGESYYLAINPDGEIQFGQQILPQAQRYHELVVDQDDNVHLLYAVYTDTTRLAYQRFGFGETPSIAPRTIAVLGWEGSYNDIIRPSLAVDTDLNVFASYFTFGTLPENLYLEKLDQYGNSVVDDKLIFPEYDNGAHGGAQTDIALDSSGNLHLLSYTDFKTGTSAAHTAYGIFDNNTETLKPMRWIIYDSPILVPTLLLDSQKETQIIFKSGNSSGYPPCGDYTLCYEGTSFEANTYNRSLPDLGTDVAHLSWDPFILRWNAPLVITGTVFNAGWYTSTATTIQVSVAISDTSPSPLDSTNVAIPSLKPYGSYQFMANLSMPFSPPPGFERLRFLRLKLDVDPNHLITETTETNNHTSAPVPIEPIPTQTKLYMVIRDDTYTILGDPNASELANTGIASIFGPDYPERQIDVTSYSTVLASDIPVGNTVISYTIGWRGKNYRDPTPVELGVKRNISDPYKIDYTPMNTAVLVTDRWASLSGTITGSDTGSGLAGAKVRLVGMGMSLEATTDGSGNFSPATLAALAKLIPGEYQVRLSREDYARQVETLTIDPLEAENYSRVMEPTKNAYLYGNVINEFGNPVREAYVDACGINTLTDEQGIFDMEVKADCTLLEITRKYYANISQVLAMTAGLETVLNVEMIFDPAVTVKGGGDRVASRVIDETTGGLLPDAPPDAGFALNELYEKFKDEFWIDYRILVLYGCYEYNLSAMYSGSPDDAQLKLVQLRLVPKTFEVHMSLGSIDFLGATIPIPIVSDSGLQTALYAIEVRLVNGKTGKPIVPALRSPLEDGSSLVLDDTTKTYDFGGASFSSSDNPEVWFYIKAGLNSGGSFDPSPLLYQYNQQILKLNLITGDIYGSYELGAFPQQ